MRLNQVLCLCANLSSHVIFNSMNSDDKQVEVNDQSLPARSKHFSSDTRIYAVKRNSLEFDATASKRSAPGSQSADDSCEAIG